jgi:hypothetical protein
VPVQILFLIFALFQAAPSPAPTVRGDRFQILVPQGWKVLNAGGYVLLEHSSGASLLVQRVNRATNLQEYAQQQAERIMAPLGFAKLGDPKVFKNTHDEWVQYEIRGNRLNEPRRILYQILRRDTGYFESIYEAGEDRFNSLLSEAQGIATSVQAQLAAPPARRTTRR